MLLLLDVGTVIMTIIVLLLFSTAIINLLIRVPYVPSSMRVVRKVVEAADIQDGEKVYDLGCGDGRLLFEAEKKAHIQGEGYELASIPYLFARIKKFFLRSNIQIFMKNFFKIDLQNADVIFCYLGPEPMQKLAEKFRKECKKGTRIISHTFQMKGFTPVKTIERNPASRLPVIYIYQI